jgi:hypothetical protein
MNSSPLGTLIGLAIAAAIAFWVYTDAKKRPMNAVGWAIGTFLLCIVILPLYLIMRKPEIGAGGLAPGLPPQPMPLPPTYPQPSQAYGQPPQPYGQPPVQQAPPWVPPPAQVAPPAAAPGHGKFCPSCGAPHEGTVKFCPNCGAAV